MDGHFVITLRETDNVYLLVAAVVEAIIEIHKLKFDNRAVIGKLIKDYLLNQFTWPQMIMEPLEHKTRFVQTVQNGMTDFYFNSVDIREVQIWLPRIKIEQTRNLLAHVETEKERQERQRQEEKYVEELLNESDSDTD